MTRTRNEYGRLFLSLLLTLLLGSAAAAGEADPFGDAEVEIAPVDDGVQVEVEDADRVEIETGPDGVRIEVEEEVPSYQTENVALTPRGDWMLQFPHTRVDLLQNRIDGYGFIDNRHEWASVWVLCNGREPLPVVDFTRELVVYYLNGLSDDRLSAVAFVTDGDLSLQESHFRGPFRPRKFFAPMHVQIVPRQGLIRLVDKQQSLLIPGGFLTEPANPPVTLQPVRPLPLEPVRPAPAPVEDDLFGE